ncbi:MAG: cytochrome C oxidase subunit IV family protein [Vicinamibacterales bacterium]|nr:cytochrome C oxidase subunit IV family protein [Vicinamibacterales bacterium]
MATQPMQTTIRFYWITWTILLVLTVLMLLIDQSPLPRLLFVLVMLVAMLVKASIIAANFMHMRFERIALAWMVVIGLLINGAILFGLIVPDALRAVTSEAW